MLALHLIQTDLAAERLIAMNETTAVPGPARRLVAKLFQPVDIASLVVFRIVFGLAIVVEMGRYFAHDWISFYWTDRTFLFKYYGFQWVHPLPEIPMNMFMALVGVMGACIALGLFYRVVTVAFFFSFAYIFLLEQAMYLNHFYLMVLLGGMLCCIPAHRSFSVDARRNPAIRSGTIPFWCLLLPVAQLSIAYFYGGIAKLDADWLQGEPMRIWLWQNAQMPIIGRYFTLEAMPYLFAWGGLALDLLIVPALLWKRTRMIAFVVGVLFHLMNSQLFPIGIFPWLMIGATTLFLPPSWPRKLLARFGSAGDQAIAPGEHLAPIPSSKRRVAIVALLAVYFTIQLTVPFRHLLYPGNASWTEEGHRFAWRMKLRDKERNRITFVVREIETGRERRIDPHYLGLSSYQIRRMGMHPDLIIQFAHYLERDFGRDGRKQVEVRALAGASLNSRRPQWLVDPQADLAAQPRNLWPAPWIMELHEPLPSHADRFRQDVASSRSRAVD
jgi:vitamin K-dependent gamma-carboxylase